uniref:Uncharacterized protein AlNc14C184G8289 n=1 Tax=Albugo laibachii Nc14 TaxID=890382 RepID=F0WPE4_9STRA|nr:conserved hypothetical protein [Albugo laibachii Nc14]|eukprot:CCA23191.1 conserved hypothetical protein [Albugo laibachii Nc14]
MQTSPSETLYWELKYTRKNDDYDDDRLKLISPSSISLTLEQTDTSVGSDDEEEMEQDPQKPLNELNEPLLYRNLMGRRRIGGVPYPFKTLIRSGRCTREIKAHNGDTTPYWSLKARIVSPRSSLISWIRGQPAQVRWQVLDHSICRVQIDVCHLGWNVPTTITYNALNTGSFIWRKVAWGMPSSRHYYINIYKVECDRIDGSDIVMEGCRRLVLIGQSEEFTVMNAG